MSENGETPAKRARTGWLRVAILALAIAAAAHAWLAARTKAPTYDETLHAFSCWLIVNHGDFRVNPEHPPLWKYVAGLPLIGMPLPGADLNSPESLTVFDRVEFEWTWMTHSIYGTSHAPRADGLELVNRARCTMLVFIVLLVVVVARWAYTWSGATAAIVAATLVAIEPNLIAHAGLVTNDVAMAAIITLASYLTWRLGERFTARNVLMLAAVIAGAVTTKFTGLLLLPMIGVPLLARVAIRRPWTAGRRVVREVARRLDRFKLVCMTAAVAALVALVATWAVYQFRGAPTPQGDAFNDQYPRMLQAYYSILAGDRDAHGGQTSDADLDVPQSRLLAFEPALGTRGLYWFGDLHMLPQAFTFGIEYANARGILRNTFLLGHASTAGNVAFFPVAILVKTPATLLLLGFASAIAGVALLVRRRRWIDPAMQWKLICLVVPPSIYLAAAMASSLNIGVRHVLPIFPPMILGVALVMASLMKQAPRAMRIVLPLAILAVAAESLRAFPDYISFFNVAAGGARGGVRLLGDSNLDWGQDLSGLADWYRDWRRTRPSEPFYLAYFGQTDPHAYGIDYVHAGPGFPVDEPSDVSELNHATFAVSVTFLQGMTAPAYQPAMKQLMAMTPIATIHDTIRIYQVDHLALLPTTAPTTLPTNLSTPSPTPNAPKR